MTWNGPHTALERFLRYVQIDTQSDPASGETPTTRQQFDLARLLAAELTDMGATEVECDDHAYVYATLPATLAEPAGVPTLCFCSHVDTAPDVSGRGVRPQVHRNYRGGPIVIDAASGLSIDEHEQPYLTELRGHTVVTASGDTLLGADDKAGVAAIMDAAHYLLAHPEIPHGRIRLLFTPDEEVGRGTVRVDLDKLGADFGYTLDGGEAGGLEGETFSADAAVVTVTGVSAHPGYAKGKMTNAARVAGHLIAALPLEVHAPEATEGREGFVHLTDVSGGAESARLAFILRDFATAQLDDHFAVLQSACAKTRERFPAARIEIERSEQYRNLGEVLARHPEVLAHAREAIRRVGLEVRESAIRGGTDGSRLSFMGLPCANLFTGMQMIHSRREYVSERDLNLAAATLVELVQVWAGR